MDAVTPIDGGDFVVGLDTKGILWNLLPGSGANPLTNGVNNGVFSVGISDSGTADVYAEYNSMLYRWTFKTGWQYTGQALLSTSLISATNGGDCFIYFNPSYTQFEEMNPNNAVIILAPPVRRHH